MNTTKSVYNKLFAEDKVELASERVELGLVQDMQPYIKGYDKYANEADGLVQRATRLKSELKDTISAIFKMSDVGDSLASDFALIRNKFEQQAKELGLDPASNKVYTQGANVYKQYYDKQRQLQTIAKELSK